MSTDKLKPIDPRINQALDKLKAFIAQRYPAATFEVAPGEDPDGVYLTATVDVEDTDEGVDTIIDRLLEIQVDQRLPVYVIPIRPLTRVLEDLQQPRPRSRPRIDWGAVLPPT